MRDRVLRLDRVLASELRANPKNWRTHPPEQREALRGVLAEVGFADAVLAREEADGGLVLIDGHLRLEECQDATLPVLVLDVDEAEADKLLATLDPLAAMAEADAAKLDSLLREVQTGNEALAGMLTDLAEEAGAVSDDDEKGDSQSKCLEQKYAILIECNDDAHQRELLERLEQDGLSCRALIV